MIQVDLLTAVLLATHVPQFFSSVKWGGESTQVNFEN